MNIVFVLFDGVTQLDFAGPVQFLSRIPGAATHVVSKDGDAVKTDAGFSILPNGNFAKADVRITGTPDLPRLDIVATTLDSSLLHVEPLTEQLAVVHEDYIIFSNPNRYEPDSLTLLEKQVSF